MKGRDHVFIGAASAGLGLWALGGAGVRVAPIALIAGAVAAGAGALAPDIDHPRSTISRGIPRDLLGEGLRLIALAAVLTGLLWYFAGRAVGMQALALAEPLVRWGWMLVVPAIVLVVVSWLASAVFGHRGATHSLAFAAGGAVAATVACLVMGLTPWWGLLFGWGWLTHLAGDALTDRGVPSLLWPFAG